MGMITVVQKGRRQVVTDTFGRPFMDVPVAERRRCITGHHLRHVIEGIVRGITAKEITHYYGGSGAATTEHMMLLPRLPQNWLFTVREQYTVLGYAVHEICHQLYTEFGIMERIFPGLNEPHFKPTNPQKHLKAFWNAVEDYRIEKICRTLFPGFPNYIDVTRDHSARKFLQRVENGEYTAANLSNPFFLGAVAVTWNGAELNRYRTQVPSLALAAINPKLRDWVMSWSPDLAKVSIVMDSLDLAQQMVDDLYKQMEDRSAPQPPPESDEPQQDEDSQPDDQNDDQSDDRQDNDQQSDDQQSDDQQSDDQQSDDQQSDDQQSDGQDQDAPGDDEGDIPGTTSADDDRAGETGTGPVDDDAMPEDTNKQADPDADDTTEDGRDPKDGDAPETGNDEDHGDGERPDPAEDDASGASGPETDGKGDDETDGRQNQATTGQDAEDTDEGAKSDSGDEVGDEPAERNDEPAEHHDQDGDDQAGEDQPADGNEAEDNDGNDSAEDHDQQADGPGSDDAQTGPDTGELDDAVADDAAAGGQDDPESQKPDISSQGGTDPSHATDDVQDAGQGDDLDGNTTDDADAAPTPPQGGGGAGGKQAPTSTDVESSEDGQATAGGAGTGAPDGTFQPEEPEDLSKRDLDFDDGDGESDEGKQKPQRPGLDLEKDDDEGDPEAADLDIDDIRKALDKVEDPEAEDPATVSPEDIGQAQDPKGETDQQRNLRRDKVTKAGAERYAALRASLGGPAMRSAGIVRRMLQSRSTTRIARGREEGDLDFERVVGMALGDSSIYRQMTRKIQVNTAISLLLDNSYSMDGHALAVCQQTAIVLDQSVTGTRTAIEITGFTSEFLTGKVRLYQYRTFEQKGNAAAASLGNMTKVQKGGTPVAVPIYDAVRRLTPRPEERKLMIIVSDGEAEDPSQSADAYAIAESMGITVVGISIGSPQNLTAMRQWCRIAHGIADIEELPQALTQIVQEILR